VFRYVLGSEGCVLAPRSSGTPVPTWAWPTWVVSRRRVLAAVFILLEFPSPSRSIFIGSHSLPPPLVRRIGPSKMTLQFERKYTTHGSGAPCHVSFGFFSGFFGIILQKLQMDPQPESRTQPKARGLLHMECDFAIALPYQLRLQDNTGIVEDLQEQHSRTLGTT
jgi:hypothetical protein